MGFNLAEHIRSNNVSYIERGPNVQKNNINIQCPFCGTDPSYHMGIHLSTGYWGCWRDESHRGSKPGRILRKLFGYSWDRIKELLGEEQQTTTQTLESLEAALEGLSGKTNREFEVFELLKEFKPIVDSGYGSHYFDYLEFDRGFKRSEIPALVERYNLRYCASGDWQDRLIIPFYIDEKLVGWTGRAIAPSQIRYKNFPTGSQSKNIIFNYDRAREGGRGLTLVEGPFDALKVDFYGQSIGLIAVAFLGVAVIDPQINMLARVSGRSDKIGILVDDDAVLPALRMSSKLAALRAETWALPEGAHDPGEMTKEQIISLKKYLK